MNIQPPVYFTTTAPLQERSGLGAFIDRVAYAPGVDAPQDRPFPFVYSITVRNGSPGTITLKARKWVVTDAAGRCHVTEGDGIGGRFPRLAPGESYSFHSYHCIALDSRAEGSLLAVDEAGRPALVRIPAFALCIPR